MPITKHQLMLDVLYKLVPGPVAGTVERADFPIETKVSVFDAMRAAMYPPPYIYSSTDSLPRFLYMPSIDRCHPAAAETARQASLRLGGCHCNLDPEACERAGHRGAERQLAAWVRSSAAELSEQSRRWITMVKRQRELEQEST